MHRLGVLHSSSFPAVDSEQPELEDDSPFPPQPADSPEETPPVDPDEAERRKYLPAVKPDVVDQQEADVEQLTVDFGIYAPLFTDVHMHVFRRCLCRSSATWAGSSFACVCLGRAQKRLEQLWWWVLVRCLAASPVPTSHTAFTHPGYGYK